MPEEGSIFRTGYLELPPSLFGESFGDWWDIQGTMWGIDYPADERRVQSL